MQRFKKSNANPILGDATTGTLFDVLVQKEGEKFRMDLSWRREKSLAVCYSDDGTHWSSPEITLANNLSTGFEDIINRNCVLCVGEIWHMWYTGQARGYSFIGYATSDDGKSFNRASPEPVLISEYPYEGASVMNPCVLYEDGIYKMWYAAGETFEPNVIAYAESTDGINWKKSKINPILAKSKLNKYEKNRIGVCQVLNVPELGYLMFYIGYKDINTACICAALSQNGKTEWRRCVKNPLITPSKFSWDADSCYKPSALYDEKMGGWRIWYNGRRGNREYIGEAFMPGTFTKDDFI